MHTRYILHGYITVNNNKEDEADGRHSSSRPLVVVVSGGINGVERTHTRKVVSSHIHLYIRTCTSETTRQGNRQSRLDDRTIGSSVIRHRSSVG